MPAACTSWGGTSRCFEDVDADLDHLLAIARFDALGHRFDGVAVDIEYIEAVTDVAERSRRLVELSDRLDDARGPARPWAPSSPRRSSWR